MISVQIKRVGGSEVLTPCRYDHAQRKQKKKTKKKRRKKKDEKKKCSVVEVFLNSQ